MWTNKYTVILLWANRYVEKLLWTGTQQAHLITYRHFLLMQFHKKGGFETQAKFFFAGIKAQWDKRAGRIVAGSHAAAYRILVSWSLDFKWTHLYIHKQLTRHILKCDMHITWLVLYPLEYKYCKSLEMSVLKVTVLQHSTCQNKKVVQHQQYLCNECLVLMILKCYFSVTHIMQITGYLF